MYVWIGEYFGLCELSSDASTKLWMCRYRCRSRYRTYGPAINWHFFPKVVWSKLTNTKAKGNKQCTFIDSPKNWLRKDDFEYLVTLRSCYLTLRRGSTYLVKPYSSHQFVRQLRYSQDLPRTLTCNIRKASLWELVSLWWFSMFRGKYFEMFIPQ